jgi:hypothetical protein
MLKFSKSARVLRAYGVFLEEIKNDIELSQLCFRTADDIEEEQSKKKKKGSHSKKEKKEKKEKGNKVGNAVKEFVPEKPTEKQPLYTIEEINKSGSKVFI